MRGEGGKDGKRGERVGKMEREERGRERGRERRESGREGGKVDRDMGERRKKEKRVYTIFYMGLFLLCAVAVITQESSTGIWKTMNTLI